MDIKTLLGLPLLQDAHRRWEHLIRDSGFEPSHPVLNFERSALAIEAAIKGHGVAIAPTYLTEDEIRAGHLVKVWQSPEENDMCLFVSWRSTDRHDRALKQVVKWVLAEFGHLETAPMAP